MLSSKLAFTAPLRGASQEVHSNFMGENVRISSGCWLWHRIRYHSMDGKTPLAFYWWSLLLCMKLLSFIVCLLICFALSLYQWDSKVVDIWAPFNFLTVLELSESYALSASKPQNQIQFPVFISMLYYIRRKKLPGNCYLNNRTMVFCLWNAAHMFFARFRGLNSADHLVLFPSFLGHG